MTIQTIIEGLENLKCINGAMYFGAVEFPCEGRETGECCKNEQTYKEAIDELHTYLQSQISTLLDDIEKNTLDQIDMNSMERQVFLSILNKYR